MALTEEPPPSDCPEVLSVGDHLDRSGYRRAPPTVGRATLGRRVRTERSLRWEQPGKQANKLLPKFRFSSCLDLPQ